MQTSDFLCLLSTSPWLHHCTGGSCTEIKQHFSCDFTAVLVSQTEPRPFIMGLDVSTQCLLTTVSLNVLIQHDMCLPSRSDSCHSVSPFPDNCFKGEIQIVLYLNKHQDNVFKQCHCLVLLYRPHFK